MSRLTAGVSGITILASTAALGWMGGWAVVTVSKVPDAWIAGKPLQLTWQVRQHGVSRLEGLEPTLEARSGRQRITGRTWEFNENGARGYRGVITFPKTGEWRVTVHSGFGRSKAELIPWRVVDSVTPVRGTVEDHLRKLRNRELSKAEQGRRMFAAMGCVTCHTHRAVGVSGEVNDVGPDLTERVLPAAYLARYLANPAIKPATNGARMPDLQIREKDIEVLVAFLSSPARTARR